MNGLTFDPWQFAGSKAYPVSAESRISWSDFSLSMSVHSRKQVQERRLPVPAWALSDTLLRSLLTAFVENRANIHKADGSLRKRIADAEARLKNRIPAWNATIDRLQLEYVRGQKDGTPKKRLDDLEQEIESLDTLIRITRKSTAAFLAATVTLYYRMGKNSVEVAAEVGAKPPLIRQILFRLHRVWQEKFQIEFMLEPAERPVPQCRSYSRAEIDSMLADGRIAIPQDKPKWVPPPATSWDLRPAIHSKVARRATCLMIDVRRAAELRSTGLSWAEVTKGIGWQGSVASVENAVRNAGLLVPGKRGPKVGWKQSTGIETPASERRAARLKAGMCGTCGKRERVADYAECEVCREYYRKKSLEYLDRKAARLASRPAAVQNPDQEQVSENFDSIECAPAYA